MNKTIPCVCRRVDGGWLFSDPMGWIAYAGEAKEPGRFYWKLHGGEVHYAESLQGARDEAEKAVLAGFGGDTYEMVPVLHSNLRMLANSFGGKQSPVMLYNETK